MKVIILAGGFGTRLCSVLKDQPKPMAPVGNKSFLEIIIQLLKKHGQKDLIFCVHYQAEKFMDYFGDGSRFGVQISYSLEDLPLGTGGAIGLLRDKLKETFCVLNGDSYQELDFKDCLIKHRTSGAICTMSLAEVSDSSRYGLVRTDEQGYVRDFREKSSCAAQGYVNAGLYIFEPEVFDYILVNEVISLEKDVLPLIIKHGQKIYSYKNIRNFFDIGIPDDYYSFLQWAGRENNI